MVRFPAGVHDDMVDAFGLIGQLLDQARPGIVPRAVQEPAKASGYKTMRSDSGSWRV
jgi:hypothetical protein